ncbi:Hpt domain-containing protein [Psychrobacter sp. DAB_AL32B]|uniref:Hpt domain-containing protein n=1 Tax=Psychrobacter sp. DAB_AL32B TaxID=1028414 RepID=UPI000B7C9638|nr:Hpt domain-containing protein [Psychrobacter sp. DAB_AL32B]OXL26531.1 histidine kinase [Psychrobacter sp. DAB_AL32B]
MAEIINNNTTAKIDDEIINNEQFEDMRDLLEEDFADLIQVYFTDCQHRITQLRTAQQEEDNANGFELAHALKGASANLGTTQLVSLSSQLQEACRANTISEHAELVEDIAIALQRAEQEINQRLGQQ